jgi:hypothetical protein
MKIRSRPSKSSRSRCWRKSRQSGAQSSGDCLHNLRSALDCLAVALVVENGFTSDDDVRSTQFPVHWSAADMATNAKTSAFFGRAGPVAEKYVRQVEPYRGGKGDALWRLHQLDILDKHRAIILVGSILALATFSATKPGAVTQITITDDPFLKEGHELARAAFPMPEHYSDADFTFAIAFGKGQIVDGQLVMPTLAEFIDFTEATIDIFARRVLSADW